MLIGMLLPALTRSKQQANSAVCKSNMHQIAIEMQVYANNNRGWLFPVGEIQTSGQYKDQYETLGTNKTPIYRWPMAFFTFSHPSTDIPPYNTWPIDTPNPDPLHDAAPWTPKIMICPSDLDAFEAHSYILNKHLAKSPEQLVKAQSRVSDRSQDQIIILGEKTTDQRDYYMEVTYDADGLPQYAEFDQKVELFRHGRMLGSNYLYKDWSVRSVPPNEVKGTIDPWAVKLTVPVVPPVTP